MQIKQKILREIIENGRTIVVDSRLVQEGDIFIATCTNGSDFYRGVEDREYKEPYKFDSHEFAKDAIKKQAGLVIVSKTECSPDSSKVIIVDDGICFLGELMNFVIDYSRKTVVGVTGSTGKSTLSELIRYVLGENHTYKHLSDRPTPISIPLKALNSKLFFRSRYAVIELPMDGLGQITQLCKIAQPDIGIILNINDSHIGQLGSINNIVSAKLELAFNLKKSGTLLINQDDIHLQYQIERLKREKINLITFGKNPLSDIQILDTSLDFSGISVLVRYKRQQAKINSGFFVDDIAYSLVGALGVGIAADVDLKTACQRLSKVSPLPGRMSVLIGKMGEIIFDDTRLATPQSTKKLFESLIRLRGRRKLLIQGPILRDYQHGKPDDELFDLMNEFDRVILVIDDSWIPWKHNYQLIKDYGALTNWYENNVTSDDIVIINGSESIRLWEFVRGIVRSDQQGLVFDPKYHD